MTCTDVDVTACLEQLEAAIDLDWERRKVREWQSFLDFEPRPGGMRTRESAGGGREPGSWPEISANDAIRDKSLMLLRELKGAYDVVCERKWGIPSIRCNYGTGILSSLFGPEIFWMPEEFNTLPTTRVLGGDDPISALLDAGLPDLNGGWGGQIFETGVYFQGQLARFEKASEVVWVYHPDLQGPVDIAELLLGEQLLIAFYDRPDDVKAVMALITETYIAFMRKWFELVPPRGDGRYMAHWGKLFKGQVMLRGDSLVNLSPDMYTEFVRPYDREILDEFGGGCLHFCGKADHVTHLIADLGGMTAINPSQPHLNDVRKLYDDTIARGIVLNTAAEVTDLLETDWSRGLLVN